MRAVVQRVSFADVRVFDSDESVMAAPDGDASDEIYAEKNDTCDDLLNKGRIVGRIADGGLVVLLGVEAGDAENDATYMADKICGLRIFEDQEGKMNLSLLDFPGTPMLAISQFTLFGDVRKGKRPSFTAAEKPIRANELYRDFVEKVKARGVPVAEGEFQADMLVRIHNTGPVTIMIDSRKTF
jgi:D-tyrosyl-tRNA(Tyr) deacylase